MPVLQHTFPAAPQQRPSAWHRALEHWKAAVVGVHFGMHADAVELPIASQTVPASPQEAPGALQPLRQTFCDWKVQQRSGAAHVVVVHASPQEPPGHASPVRHVGRPVPVPGAHSPSHTQGEPGGFVPTLTQKPRSVPPPHAPGAWQTRHSELGSPVTAQVLGPTGTQTPPEQHSPG